jgi:hypothetical protein
MPSYVLILSLIAVSLLIAIFCVLFDFILSENLEENPSDIWDEPAATTGIPTWGAATTAVATQYSSHPIYHCNEVISNENDENEKIKYAMFFKDITDDNNVDSTKSEILELLGGNVSIFSGYLSSGMIKHPDVHFIDLDKNQLEILLSDNQSPILSIECPVVLSYDFSCFAIGCEEEIMYPRTFEISRNLFYRMPTTPAATTGMPRFSPAVNFLCDEESAVKDSSKYATIFKSEESRIKVSESFHSHFNYEIRFQQSYFINTHPHVYLIYLTDTERDFLLTLSPLIVSMECEIALNPDMVYCAAIGCTDSGKWPHSFG